MKIFIKVIVSLIILRQSIKLMLFAADEIDATLISLVLGFWLSILTGKLIVFVWDIKK